MLKPHYVILIDAICRKEDSKSDPINFEKMKLESRGRFLGKLFIDLFDEERFAKFIISSDLYEVNKDKYKIYISKKKLSDIRYDVSIFDENIYVNTEELKKTEGFWNLIYDVCVEKRNLYNEASFKMFKRVLRFGGIDILDIKVFKATEKCKNLIKDEEYLSLEYKILSLRDLQKLDPPKTEEGNYWPSNDDSDLGLENMML